LIGKNIYQYKLTNGGRASVTRNLKTENMATKFYITFLNKEKSFQKDIMYFETYENAVEWALQNLGNFNPDMIQINY